MIRHQSTGEASSYALDMGLNPARLPAHLAIIMDGNGRWARSRLLGRERGHRQGAEAARQVVTFCRKIGIPILTLYAFSLENWSRPNDEVAALMEMLNVYLDKEFNTLMENGICLAAMGRLNLLPGQVREKLLSTCQATEDNKGMLLNLAISYGGRAEIVDAVKALIQDIQKGRLCCEDINENLFSRYLYTGQLPDPDLLLRTGGEMRISNFLLWQTAYTEIYVTEKLWPDFNERDLCQALLDFQRRERRFGLTGDQVSRQRRLPPHPRTGRT